LRPQFSLWNQQKPSREGFLFSKKLNLKAQYSFSPGGEIGRHIGLKIRRFVHSGRAGSIPARGTID
jgi:hypothetical protein